MHRRLPDFIIIGAAKAGTTALAVDLRDHPQVFMPGREVHFFDRYWERGLDWYVERFAKAPDHKIIGEKTPNYMSDAQFMSRAAQVVPDVKLILLTRDPSARLLSHVNMDMAKGRIPTTDVVDADWLRREVIDRPRRNAHYVARGFYREQIARNVLPYFDERQLLVRSTDAIHDDIDPDLLHEGVAPDQLRGELASDAYTALMADVCRFIGVDPIVPHRAAGVRRYGFTVTDDATALLSSLYGQDSATPSTS